MKYEEIKEAADKYLMPTYSRFDAVLERGRGAVLTDVRGGRYIDFTSGIGVSSLGYGDEQWANAVAEQVRALAHTSNLYYSEPTARLAEALCRRGGFDRVFFCNSGAEANECAIKLARKYSFDRYGRGRHTVITLKNSFHGRTMAALTATGQDTFHDFFFPFNGGFKYAEPNDISDLDRLFTDDVCAVMAEPIQGEGGVRPLDAEYLRALSERCRQNDALLIIDEVQTGIGRTGRFFAFEHYGILPDIVTSAKGLGNGLPIGACLCREPLANTLTAGTHGTTFGGNPAVCAGALEVLARVDGEMMSEVSRKGEYIRSRLSDCGEIEEISGMGLMLGIELKGKSARQTAESCLQRGLLILTAKERLRLLPPLTISFEELDAGIEILKSVLDEKEAVQ